MTVSSDETGWGVRDGDKGFNTIVAGLGKMEVDSASTVFVLFLFGRKAAKSLPFLFFEREGFFLGTGFSGGVRIWDVDLVRGLELVTAGVFLFFLTGEEGGVRESSLGTGIVEGVSSANRGELGVGLTGECGVSSCCSS